MAGAIDSKADPTGIFLAPGDNIAIGSPKVNVYGSIGIENVILGAGSSQVVLDQNVERVYLSAAPFAYRFQQSGIRLDGYAETGSDPIFSAALQNDADGTVLVFPSGSASAKVSAAGMTLGGATVSSTVPFAVSPSLGGYVAPPTAATNTGVFLGQNANFTAASAGLKLYGAAGGEVVALKRGVSDISVDQLVDRVQFDGLATAALRFQQQGINLLVYDESTLLARIPLQSDVDGTLVTTTTGTVQAKVSATGMFLGGVRVSANEASSLVPADVDSSLKAAPGGIGPLITLFTSTSDNGIYKAGSTINITAVASEALAAGSQITVTLETGTTDRTVVLTRDGTDATKLMGSYTVQAGDTSADLTVASFTLGGSAGANPPADSAGNAMTATTLPVEANNLAGLKALVVDTPPPTVLSFSSTTADGTYKAGAAINITAVASEALAAGSQITVTLETGATDRTVVLTRDGTDATKLMGSYTVQAGDTSADLTVASFTLGGSAGANAPADLAGNLLASTALPVAPNNLGDRKALVIDTVVRLSQAGRIQDGYIAGATVFADADGDGVLDAGEASAVSDAQGNFSLSGVLGNLVATGGKDISTNLDHTTLLKAPAGATIVNPLTTLVSAVAERFGVQPGVESSALVQQAQRQVAEKLGLPATTMLTTLDPLVVAGSATATAAEKAAAVSVFKASAQVANVLVQTAAAVSSASGSTGSGNVQAALAAADKAADALAQLITQASPSATLDLGGAQTLKTVLTESAKGTAAETKVAAVVDQVAAVMAATNAEVAKVAITGTDVATALQSVVKAQVVAQGSAAAALAQAVNTGQTGTLTSSFTGTALATQVTAAAIGTIGEGIVVPPPTPPPVVTPTPPVVTPPPPPVTFTVAPDPSRADLLVLGGNATGIVTITLAAPSGGITKATFSRDRSQVSDVQVTDRWIQLPNEGSQVSMVINGTDGPDLVRFDASGLSSAGLLLTGDLGGDLDTIGFRFTQSGQPLLQTEQSSLRLINAEFAVFESNSGVDVGFPSTSSFKAFDSLTFSGGDFDLTGLGAGALADGVQILLVGSIA